MRMRSIIAGALITSMLFSLAASASDPTPAFGDVQFTHQNSEAIEYLHSNQVVEGYDDGTYQPAKRINRAEFLKIVLETANIPASGENCYPDVQANWFAPYVCKATELGHVAGYPDGSFHPEREINFAEAGKIIANVLDLKPDAQDSTIWFKPYVVALENKNAIPAEINAFEYPITRGQMAEMVWRIAADVTTELSNTYENIDGGFVASAVSEKLVAFASCTELKEYMVVAHNTEAAQKAAEEPFLDFTGVSPTTPTSSSPVPESASTTSSTDFSSTNVQVQGVDEADIVKNDGEYIYVLKGSTIRIIKAYQPENLFETAIIHFDDTDFSPTDMYVDGNKLVVLGGSYEVITKAGLMNNVSVPYYPAATTTSKVYIYDISNKTAPTLDREVKIEGALNTSRKIDDMVYVVSNKFNNSYYVTDEVLPQSANLLPLITDSSNSNVKISDCDQVLYHPGSEVDDYVIVTGISVANKTAEPVSKVAIGSSDKVYASSENIYVAEGMDTLWYVGGGVTDHTIVNKFSLSPTKIDYTGRAKVPGHVLDQFSMDENDGYFRIATTKGYVWNEEDPSKNNLYIFDKDLTKVGEIEGIAQGEEIHSVRFMGGRAYMVTFKKIDPLFVIDVSTPTTPKVLGQLKIPGFSDYLHPIDENHLIGFGLDTLEAQEFEKIDWNQDFAWYQGVKIAMFDVTDVTSPKEIHHEIIGDRGTDTPLRFNHKALLYSPEKGTDGKILMALPIRLSQISEELKNNPETPGDTYGEYIGQYAYIYDVSIKDGFQLRDKVSHYAENEAAQDYYRSDKNINRILYIGNFLYTVSRSIVQAHNLDTLTLNNEVQLEDLGDETFEYWF